MANTKLLVSTYRLALGTPNLIIYLEQCISIVNTRHYNNICIYVRRRRTGALR